MRRTCVAIIAIAILIGIGSQAYAGLFQRLFGAGGGCANGSCGVSASSAMMSGYSGAGTMMEVERRGLFGSRRARIESAYSAPMEMSFSAPMVASSCYSSSFSSQRTYSVPVQSYSVPVQSIPIQSYSIPAPTFQLVPVAPQTQQAMPSSQSFSAPPPPSKTLPQSSQEYAPAKPSSTRRSVNSKGFRREVREVPPEVAEKPPTSRLGCFGKCCGYEGECECGDDCQCSPPPGARKAKSGARTKFVDYSRMAMEDITRMVDYSSVSNVSERTRTSMR